MIMIRCVNSFLPHCMDIIPLQMVKPHARPLSQQLVSNLLRHQPNTVNGAIHFVIHQSLDVFDGLIQSARLRETDRNKWVSLSNFPNATCAHKASGVILEADAQPGTAAF